MFQIQPATPETQFVQPLRRFAQPVCLNLPTAFAFGGCRWSGAYLSCSNRTGQASRLRNFDTEPLYPYCYEPRTDNRLESVANAHTAADLHVRPVSQTALVSRAVGAANDLRDTSCLISRNENDSKRVLAKSTSRSLNQAADSARDGKVLNLCGDSKCRTAVTIPTIAQNKFTNCLRLSRMELSFRTTGRHYADK